MHSSLYYFTLFYFIYRSIFFSLSPHFLPAFSLPISLFFISPNPFGSTLRFFIAVRFLVAEHSALHELLLQRQPNHSKVSSTGFKQIRFVRKAKISDFLRCTQSLRLKQPHSFWH
ncbi:hypothetical protein I3842_14G132800 [Carya illinoinensis]|uniref:Uncharacterized protein n=1 Tax=Carya illinoinensis TaxID=32201 RepID=A0A922D4Y3_CARIL|nr:hypothetical protein I3842_14G132800 [Carya illinoinensis]